MDSSTIFDRVLFSSFMEEIHDDFKQSINENNLSEHQEYLKLHAFNKLAQELIQSLKIKPSQLADFINTMTLSKHIHEVSGLNNANVYTDSKDFLNRMFRVLEDKDEIGQIVPLQTLSSIFPTDDELKKEIDSMHGFCEEEDIAQSTSPERVVDFFSEKSWRQIAICDETEIMGNTDWSDFEWEAWKYINDMGENNGFYSINGDIFSSVQVVNIAASAAAGSTLKSAVESLGKKSNNTDLKIQ